MPSAKRISEESGIAVSSVAGTGKDGRVTKGDMLGALESRQSSARSSAPQAPAAASLPARSARVVREERVLMTRLRVDHRAAPEGTAGIPLPSSPPSMRWTQGGDGPARCLQGELLEKKHGVKLGFMGFFVSAVIAAPKELLERQCRDRRRQHRLQELLATSAKRRRSRPSAAWSCRWCVDADHLSLAGIEKAIGDFGARALENKLKLEELQGGTFSITNGGVFGSLMVCTPILNSPSRASWA